MAEAVANQRLRPPVRTAPEDERDLVRSARAGSRRAAEELVRRHWTDAYRAAYVVIGDAAEAEDVAQEALLSALRSMHRFRDGRPLGPWIHRIAVNHAIDVLRARDRRPCPSSPTVDATAGHAATANREDGLHAAVLTLPADQRAVIVLRFVLGYGPEEIAAMLGIPRGTVGSRLRRGLDAIRAEIEDGR